jgi:hypothetical protein
LRKPSKERPVPTDSTARTFIETNIDHYREVTLAVKVFEAEIEGMLRSIWREFRQQLGVIGIPADDPSFEAKTRDDVSDMYLKTGWNTGIQIGLVLECRDEGDELGRFAVHSGVWVKDPHLRKPLDNHVAAQLSPPFVHDFRSSTTYITAYIDPGKKSEVIDLLREGFRTLFECLFGSPEFCQSYNISGPVDMG